MKRNPHHQGLWLMVLVTFVAVQSIGCAKSSFQATFSNISNIAQSITEPSPLANPAPGDDKISIFSAKDDSGQLMKFVGLGGDDSSNERASESERGIPLSRLLGLELHSGPLNAMVVTKSGLIAFTGGEDGVVNSIDLRNGVKWRSSRAAVVRKVVTSEKPILALALSVDERFLAVGQNSSVTVVELATGKISYQLTRVQGRVSALAWDPRGEFIAIGLTSGSIHLWSLREGFFEGRGRDSEDALETYAGGKSPIVAIAFHPSGGAFFGGEQDGVVSMWRLLRTESEIGLRDRFAVTDQPTESRDRRVLGSVKAPLAHIWLDWDGGVLYAVGAEGGLYSWKVRGLVGRPKIDVFKGELFSVLGASSQLNDNLGVARNELETILVSGRDQRLGVVCISSVSRETEGGGTWRSEFLARSALLPQPISRLSSGADSNWVWAATKSGSVMLFDFESALMKDIGAENLIRCKG